MSNFSDIVSLVGKKTASGVVIWWPKGRVIPCALDSIEHEEQLLTSKNKS